MAGLGVLGLTAIIQLTCPGYWPNEALPWSAMALVIVAFGPGKIALDRLIVASMKR